MSLRLKRTMVLSFSRFTNQAIVLFSPLLLVRMLPVSDYGSYREFLLYVGFILPVVSFGVARSLVYFIPKYPRAERVWITQTVGFVLVFSTFAVVVISVFGEQLRANISFDFVTSMQLYVFFFVNLDFVEMYWLSTKRSDLVLYYSSGRLILRTAAVLILAYATRDVPSIIFGLIILEVVRCIAVLSYIVAKGWFTASISKSTLRIQSKYFLPMGTGAVIETLSNNISLLYVSAAIGPEALAFFVLGIFGRKIVDVFRGAISDVIFPDIVSLRNRDQREALTLWIRATVWYCILLFPFTIVFFYYSDALVTVLFTSSYIQAAPVFSVFALLLMLDCFDFHLPLRAQNANRYFMHGSMLALAVNAMLLIPLHALFGLIGPAIGLVVSRLVITVYLAIFTCKVYKTSIGGLLPWKQIALVSFAAILAAPILVVGRYFVDSLWLRLIFSGGAYLVTYFCLLRLFRITELEFMQKMFFEVLRVGRSRGAGN